jgi:hypothetical protein
MELEVYRVPSDLLKFYFWTTQYWWEYRNDLSTVAGFSVAFSPSSRS